MTDLVNPSLVFNDIHCYACGSNTTHIKRTRTGRPYPGWYLNRIDGQYLCEKCENHLIKGPRYHPLTNPRRNKKHHKSCKFNCGPKGKPSSGRTENYSSPPLPSSMQAVVRVSQFAHPIRKENFRTNINKTNKQQSDSGGA
jgi:hypothetical protein